MRLIALLAFAGILATIAAQESTMPASHPSPRVGAIRWDAWTGGNVTVQVERSLAPERFRFRLPWFAEVRADGTVRIDGGRQAVMDQEIAYAADAGLDHWAFLLYPEASSMSASLRLYLASPARSRLGFCLILHNAFSVDDAAWPRERDRAIALLREPGYRTVAGGRPLVYLFEVKRNGTLPVQRIAEFRSLAAAGGADPYLVYMGWNPQADHRAMAPHGFAAVSAYASCSDDPTFARLAQRAEWAWRSAAEAGVPWVPLVTTGWEKQPRKENPVSWELDHGYHRQAVFPSVATPGEIAGHLSRAIDFVRAHPAICQANTVVTYAWNEHDEGGWLCPTWTPNGPDTSRLDAIRQVLRPQP
jgi:hypothetical protein